jgi:uncharacterized protein YdeI (YjbR/CyaY-like superfamily)
MTRTVTVPRDLRTALSRNKTAAAHFTGLAYSHKREYVDWILEAKKPETRARRIARTIVMLTGRSSEK